MTWHLETERLRLRPMEVDDEDALLAVLGDPIAMRFYPRPFDRLEVHGWIGRVRERYERDGFGLLAVVERSTGEVVGDCGPMLMETGHGVHVELGWHIRRDRQGLGFASEAAETCRDHAWSALGVDHLISIIRPENVGSWRVARRLGFAAWRGDVRAGMAHLLWRLDARDARATGALTEHGATDVLISASPAHP
jgi:RimJ/RimL family protein N-acetyltransferase